MKRYYKKFWISLSIFILVFCNPAHLSAEMAKTISTGKAGQSAKPSLNLGTPNLTPNIPSGWSDKIVVSKTQGTNRDDSPLYETDTLYIDWSVTNNGSAVTTNIFYTDLYVDGVVKKSWMTDTPMNPGDAQGAQDYPLGQLSAGSYHNLTIVTDTTNTITESNEGDNSFTKFIYIDPAPLPNLTPYQPSGWSDEIVVSTSTGTNTDTTPLYNTDDFYVDWAMINNGSADVSAFFYTYLYVDGGYRTSWITNPPISPSIYYFVQDYNIGKLSAGSHTVETLTDPDMRIPEIDDSDNRYIKTISVNASPQSLQLTYPVNTTITSSDVNFQWQAYSGATKYVLLVDNNSGFGSPEINKEYTTTTTGIFSNYFPTNTYYWKVIAYNGWTYLTEAQSSFTYTPVDASAKPVFVPLYRLYNSSDKDHFYVTTQSQVDTAKGQDFNYEKIECYISDRKFTGSVPLMRLYSGSEKSHFYTMDEAEKDSKITTGYAYEGVSGYVYNSSVQGLVALYHLYHSENGDHFYTISQFERDNAKNSYSFQDYGTAAYVSADGKVNPFAADRPSAFVGWGINAAAGSLEISSYNHEDLSVNSLHMPFVFERYYNSNNSASDGSLGYGWSHNYNVRLIDNGSAAIVQWGDGNDDFYAVSGSAYTADEPGLYDTLVREADPSVYTLTKKDQTKYTFSIYADSDYMREARLRSIIEKNGYGIQIWPDSLGRIEWMKDTNARQYNFSYTDSTAQAKISKITDRSGRTLNFGYSNGYLTTFTNARGLNTTYQYGTSGNSFGKLVQITLPKGNTYAVGYDSSGRVLSQQEGNNSPLELTYNYGETGKTKVEDPLNKAVYYTHDTDFRLKRFEDSLGKIAETWYEDSRSQNTTLPTKIKDRRGYYTNFTYDERGNLLSKRNAKDETTSYTYDSKNNVLTMTNGRSYTTNYEYDSNQRNLVKITDPLRHETKLHYNSYAQIDSLQDAENRTTTYSYDGAYHELTEIRDDLNNKTNFTYDTVSRLKTKTDTNGTTTTNYDNNDNVLSVVDPLNTVTYNYDDNDNLNQITYGTGQVVLFNYDEHDRLKEEIDPLSRKKSYLYDEFGQVKQTTDANNHTAQYSYNSNNQLSSIDYSDDPTVTFAYDENGNRKTMTDAYGTSTYEYDPLNRISKYSPGYVGLEVSYDYDAAGNLSKIIYPSSRIVTYNYDPANRLENVVDWNNKTTQYGYDFANLLKTILYPNGVLTSYEYDAAKRLNVMTNQLSGGQTLSSYRFAAFDGVGNPTQLDLTDVLPVSLSSVNTASSYDNADQLKSSSGTYSYISDNNGNRKNKSGPGTTTAYGYDDQNRLKEMVGGVHSSEFKYDGDGLRIAATRDNVETKYLLDIYPKLEQPIAEVSSQGTSYNIYGLGLIYTIIDPDTANSYHYYHYNYRGDTVAISDQSQNIVNKYRYDEFGHVMNNQVEGISNRFKFMGQYAVTQEMDDLSFVRARFYDPLEGRFLQKDPSGYGEGVNLYPYAGGNPVMRIDPSGLAEQSILEPLIHPRKFYNRIHDIRIWGQNNFPDSHERHYVASYIISSEYGIYWARRAGIANEIQGFLWHDIWRLRSRFKGDSPWAFSLNDLRDNEKAFRKNKNENKRTEQYDVKDAVLIPAPVNLIQYP